MARVNAVSVCELCGADYHRHCGNTGQRFCSQKCHLQVHNTTEHQRTAARAAGLVIAAKTRGTGDGYVKENGRHQHRVVAERTMGRPLRKGEIVHHVNGVFGDNRPENLQVMTQAEHARLHMMERWHGTV